MILVGDFNLSLENFEVWGAKGILDSLRPHFKELFHQNFLKDINPNLVGPT